MLDHANNEDVTSGEAFLVDVNRELKMALAVVGPRSHVADGECLILLSCALPNLSRLEKSL